jgi:hypothetical protein
MEDFEEFQEYDEFSFTPQSVACVGLASTFRKFCTLIFMLNNGYVLDSVDVLDILM